MDDGRPAALGAAAGDRAMSQAGRRAGAGGGARVCLTQTRFRRRPSDSAANSERRRPRRPLKDASSP